MHDFFMIVFYTILGVGAAIVSLLIVFWLLLIFGKNRNLK